MFETFIVQPIFNLLVFLYAIIGDFGVAIILFTIVFRLAMWPILRKQLHQGKIMRKIQPEIKEIRARNKGNRPQESTEMMELYKKHGVSTFSSIGLLFVQLPVFFGLFSALRSLIDNPDRIIRLPYSFIRDNDRVKEMFDTIANKTDSAIQSLDNSELMSSLSEKLGSPVSVDKLRELPSDELSELFSSTLISHTSNADGVEMVGPVGEGFQGSTSSLVQGPFFEQQLFGSIDMSSSAFNDGSFYIPVVIIAVLAGVFQYFQSRQLLSQNKNTKSISEIMSESAKSGKEPDQSEISAAVGKRMGLFFAPLITFISITSPAGLALYFATSGLVGLVQQKTVLKQDEDEMELIADVTEKSAKNKTADTASADDDTIKKKGKRASKKSKSRKKRKR